MPANTKNSKIIIALIPILVINIGMAQRPSFAGSRPADGLSQKDKYLITTPGNADLQNRFGGSDNAVISNLLPFGQKQNPPIGYPVVLPESVYTAVISSPRPSSFAATASSTASNGLMLEDRFGETNTNTATSTVASALPLDAHGDRELINQLNQIPVDKRPFWFLNYQAIEAQRNGSANNFAGAQGSRGSFFG